MKTNFKKINNVVFFVSFLFFPFSSFAGSSVDIHGKIKSYDEGVYRIQTDRNIVNVECSRLLQAYTQGFTTGQQVHITVPTAAVMSYEVINPNRAPVRAPASVSHQKVGIGR